MTSGSKGLDRARARMGGRFDPSNHWSNWTGDQRCRPSAYVEPRNEEEVVQAIEHARRRGWTVRVVGSGHSFTDGVLTNGMMISLRGMNRVKDIDPSAGLVKLEAGISLHDLNGSLAQSGLALENLGDVDVQSLAGATATGTHGTGARFKNLSANITAMRLLLADGSSIEVSETSDADTWRAARIGLGALGVVTEMTLKAFPAFVVRGVDDTRPLEAVLENLDHLVDTNDHFEFYAFPHSPIAMTRTNNRVDDPPRPRNRAAAWLRDIVFVNHVFDLVCRTGRRFPSAIPRLNRLSARLSGGSERVDSSYRIFASPRLVRFTETEYAIPREKVAEVVRETMSLVPRKGYDVPIPFEVRFVRSDDAFLSPAYGRETAYVAVHMFQKMEWEPLFSDVRSIMNAVGGRPHWGKRHFETAKTLAPLYPEWDSFQKVRRRLDPSGTFANAHVERVLGPH